MSKNLPVAVSGIPLTLDDDLSNDDALTAAMARAREYALNSPHDIEGFTVNLIAELSERGFAIVDLETPADPVVDFVAPTLPKFKDGRVDPASVEAVLSFLFRYCDDDDNALSCVVDLVDMANEDSASGWRQSFTVGALKDHIRQRVSLRVKVS